MSSSNYDTISKALSVGAIVAIVVGSVIGLIVLITCIIVIVCLIKYCNRPRYPIGQGAVLQYPYQYPSNAPPQYPSNMTSVANYPPPYQPVPPPYNAPASDSTKSPYT
ncbi:unnamed protein product [Rotaria sordida]|uniref:Cysteine and tyrosine-rich protein 1 n=1 Tax=Rotaria sordida TaxID=392033 RepID=A0A814ZPZ3_9BILA|nr:unnamed protein product [Rotaria sordida]CAF0864621.1 unnamed protein product [Rotaria sordida]CAF1245890.1 unnamed protein product [Rotaria sordida]CAF3564139.1 unnamed protein product [Rotaria sordida]CAF3776249.1 unnamed protein product [Rotaria sordida]